MNKILQEIIATDMVETVDGEKISLDQGIHIPTGEGMFLQGIIGSSKPVSSLEIGFAYGVSTLFICESLRQVEAEKHVVIDPFQNTLFKGIGLRNVREAGYESLVEFIEESSELALPNLLRNRTHFDFVFIDGGHAFEQVLLDFYYVNRMLNLEGIVAFDDASWPSIHRACCYISRYPCYRVHSYWPTERKPIPPWLNWATVAYYGARNITNKMRYLRSDLKMSRRRCIAFQKVSEDTRNYDWFQEF